VVFPLNDEEIVLLVAFDLCPLILSQLFGKRMKQNKDMRDY